MHIDAGAFETYRNEIANAFNSAGQAGISSMPKTDGLGERFVIRFDGSNTRAEETLRRNSGNAITNIVEGQRQMVRDALSAGLARGDGPRTTALDLVGRINKQTGLRSGGLIGLTGPQADALGTARNAIKTGDYASYLSRSTRNKTFDKYVFKARDKDIPIPAAIEQKMFEGMSNNMLKLRGETVARTETLGILHAGRREAFLQAVDTGKVQSSEVEREWQDSGLPNTRDSHLAMDGETVGLDEPYSNGLMYPGDPSGEASEVINCACTEAMRINFLSRIT